MNNLKYSDKDITFICHVRIDNERRIKNIKTIYNFYKKNLPNCNFIFVEDDEISKFNEIIKINNDDLFLFLENKNLIKKTTAYNLGASKATRPLMVFLDVDVIIDTNKLLQCINVTYQNNNNICLIGYNGIALYFTQQGEQDFLNTLNIQDLYKKIDFSNIRQSYQNDNMQISNINAVGGCVIINKESFNYINGFNPFFNGWGYEDNEIISRAHILGLNVFKSNINNHFLYHLPHDISGKNKSYHLAYKNNEAIVRFVESLDKTQLLRYIKQW